MKNNHSVINKFISTGYLLEPFCDKVYSAVLLEIEFNIPLEFVKRLIIKRYQLGEVNNMKYADSVVINNSDFICNYQKRTILLSTNDFGYGKSVDSVTYYVQVIPEISPDYNGIRFFDSTDIVCITTLQNAKD